MSRRISQRWIDADVRALKRCLNCSSQSWKSATVKKVMTAD
jgi:hypothetical protein